MNIHGPKKMYFFFKIEIKRPVVTLTPVLGGRMRYGTINFFIVVSGLPIRDEKRKTVDPSQCQGRSGLYVCFVPTPVFGASVDPTREFNIFFAAFTGCVHTYSYTIRRGARKFYTRKHTRKSQIYAKRWSPRPY